MKYTKRIISSLIFVIGLILILIPLSNIAKPKDNSASMGMEEVEANGILGEKENTIDIVIVGDSVSHQAINPLQIWNEEGYTAYNCGSNSQLLDYSLVLLQRVFEKQSPKVVILETDNIYNYTKAEDYAISELKEILPVFRYHNRWKSLEKTDLENNFYSTYTEAHKGYRLNNKVNPADTNGYMKVTEECAKIPFQNVQAVKAIKSLCEKNGATLILVSVPSTTNWSYERHNGMVKLADELDLRFLDINMATSEINLDWNQDTRDAGDHMNCFGAKKVSIYLATYLKETNLLTSHKDDPEYASWNDSYLAYDSIPK